MIMPSGLLAGTTLVRLLHRSENSNCLYGTAPRPEGCASRPDEGCLDQMLGEKPCLLFARADHVRDDEVIASVIS